MFYPNVGIFSADMMEMPNIAVTTGVSACCVRCMTTTEFMSTATLDALLAVRTGGGGCTETAVKLTVFFSTVGTLCRAAP